jgi:ATP-dependent Clp protease ATP-binding subunit ClpA
MKSLLAWFRPEFLNRIDDIILYNPLTEIMIEAIAALEIEKVVARLAKQQIELRIDPEVIVHIAQVGFDPTYGARPLKRAIQNEILTPLAQRILSSDSENSVIEVKMEGGKILV